jgi:hypothetical protein
VGAAQEVADTKVSEALRIKARALYDARDPGIGELLRKRGCEKMAPQGADPADVWWECLKTICGSNPQI